MALNVLIEYLHQFLDVVCGCYGMDVTADWTVVGGSSSESIRSWNLITFHYHGNLMDE